MSGLVVEGRVDIRCTREAAWDLFSRFGDIAALIPSVEDVRVEGDCVYARVATKLGALPISSRVKLEVVESRPLECLKARGVSYLGETIAELPKNVEGVDPESAGQLFLHLDLRDGPEDGLICIVYIAEIEAKGRLKRIYQAILKTKVPGMMEQFAQNIRGALESVPAPIGVAAPHLAAGEPAQLAALLSSPVTARPIPEESEVERPLAAAARPADRPSAAAPRGAWASLVRWMRRLLGLGSST